MIVRVGMAARAAGLSPQEFQNHQILEDGLPLLPHMLFDSCSEIEFDSLATMEAGFASEQYQRVVVADEQAMIERDRFAVMLTDRRSRVRSFTASGPYRDAVAAERPLRHEQLLGTPGAGGARVPAIRGAVDVLWFEGPERALAFVRGEAANRAAWEVAGAVFGREWVLARPKRVV